jgi:hypothetical protein
VSFARLEEVATYDDDGEVQGFQFGGKERRIQEWKEKQEEKEFAALIEKLQKRNSARKARTNPESLSRIREIQKKHQASGRKQERARELRREKYEANPIVNVCEECGKAEAVPFDKIGVKRSKFCSRSCRNRNHGKSRVRPTLGIRKMDIEEAVLSFLRSAGETTSKEITDAIQGKKQSVATLLCRWSKEGVVLKDDGRPAKYSVKGKHES